MAATVITQYLGQGLAASRPATPSIDAGSIGWYYATDTAALSYYANGTWNSVSAKAKLAYPLASLASLSNSQNFGSRGTLLTAGAAVTVTDMFALMTPVNTGTYKLGIAPFNTGTQQITSAPNYTAPIVAASSLLQSLNASLLAPLTLTAQATYLAFIVRTDVVGTTAMNMTYSTTAKAAPGFVPLGASSGYKLASNGPLTSDAWTSEAADYSVGPIYTLP